jgi:hypothetical protein
MPETASVGAGELREVGFWAASPATATDCRPHPSAHVDPVWARSTAAQQLASYLRAGYVESYEMGYSNCRFGGSDGCDCPAGPWVDMGCIALTDGEFVWPEGLAHYVECHAVRPPCAAGAALLAKATSPDGQGFVLCRHAEFAADVDAASASASASALLEWDAQKGKAVRMAGGMAAVVGTQSRLVANRMQQQQPEHASWYASERILGLLAMASLAAAVFQALSGWPLG